MGGGKSKIIEEWREGSEWYRVWSSGLIEQGGKLSFDAVIDSYPVVTMAKEMSSTDYSIFITPLTTNRSGNNPGSGFVGSTILTKNTFVPKYFGANGSLNEAIVGWVWCAIGY